MDTMDQTSLELLQTIQHRDRRFRLAQTVFMSIVALILCGVLIALYAQNQSLSNQANDRARNVQKLLDAQDKTIAAQKEEIETTNRYIQCIAQFFATTDRTSRIITDLDSCNIQSNGQRVGGVNLTPTQQQAPTNNSGGGSNNSTGNSSGGTGGAGGNGGDGGNGGNGSSTTSEPVRILGIPVCVPLLNVCVEQ